MTFADTKKFICSDLFRYCGDCDFKNFIYYLFWSPGMPGFRYTFLLRLLLYFKNKRIYFPLYMLLKLFQIHFSYRYGIWIHPGTRIGYGFYIGHYGGIIVNSDATIGNNCNISHGVTIGQSNRGKNIGTPTLHDNIYIGPNATIIGNIEVGNCVAIGANSVVTRDIPDHAVVVGIPANIISMNGSQGYVNNQWKIK